MTAWLVRSPDEDKDEFENRVFVYLADRFIDAWNSVQTEMIAHRQDKVPGFARARLAYLARDVDRQAEAMRGLE